MVKTALQLVLTSPMQVIFKIFRKLPTTAATFQEYALDVEPGTTILDCLNRIKWEQDGTLAFRKNCRNTICGSCAMRINGRSALACKENVGSELQRLQQAEAAASVQAAGFGVRPDGPPVMLIAPMGNMPVVKDLIVDMQPFWQGLKTVDPAVQATVPTELTGEFLQSPTERSRLNQVGNCILCGACYSECNAREVNPEFVGPHALAKAYRMVADSRDRATEDRLEAYNEGTAGVWGCTRCYYCNAVCPMEVAPMDQIGKIKSAILARKDAQASRSIRHRKTLIDLVKQGGWIDERQFGLRVVGNSFRDWGGLMSLGPLGLRMISTGKFPLRFEPSEGTQTVRSLVEAVQALDPSAQVEMNTDTPEPVGG